MRALALDIGQKRVGIAFGDTERRIAMPVCILALADIEAMTPAFRRVVEDYEPDLLVAGRPLTMSGEPGPQAQRVEGIARGVAKRLGLNLEFMDERLSSIQAKRILQEQGLNERQMRGKLDSIAASLFLQTWLDCYANTMMGDS